jgi:hypothetical protein
VVARPLDLLVGPSINTGIKYGKDFFKQTIGSSPDAFGLTCAEIDGLDLLNHHEACHLRVVRNSHVEGKLPICVGYGTDDCKTCVSVEQGIADNKRRTPTSLLVSGLRVKSDRNEVALLGKVSTHLPHLSTDGFSPLHFRAFVGLGDS